MSRKQEFNRFSEESQQFLVDMHHTEIFELCENSAKHQCLDCNVFSEIGIYCSCGKHLKYKRSPTTTKKPNNDYTSIPGFVIKKNSTLGPKHGNLNDKSCSSRRRRCLRKQDKKNMAAIRRYFQGGKNKKDTEGHWRGTILAKRTSSFSIASVLKDMTLQLHELNGYRTPGHQKLFDSDQNLSMHQKNA